MRYRWLTLTVVFLVPALPAGAQLNPRTIDLKGIISEGSYVALPPRTIDLKGINAAGEYFPLKPRTIDLKGINALGSFLPLKPRTIDLKAIQSSGVSVKISRTFQLPGWTAAPPQRGKRP